MHCQPKAGDYHKDEEWVLHLPHSCVCVKHTSQCIAICLQAMLSDWETSHWNVLDKSPKVADWILDSSQERSPEVTSDQWLKMTGQFFDMQQGGGENAWIWTMLCEYVTMMYWEKITENISCVIITQNHN